MDFDIIVELIEDTIDLAEEEGEVSSQEQFLSFIEENIPEDILAQLNDTFISSSSKLEDSDNDNGGGDGNAFLIDVYQERFAQDEEGEEDESDESNDMCVLCLRPWTHCKLTRHHVYPRETHAVLLKRSSSVHSKASLLTTICVCRLCHNAIHRFHSNRKLAEELYSVPLLRSDEKIASFCKWVSKQGARNAKMK